MKSIFPVGKKSQPICLLILASSLLLGLSVLAGCGGGGGSGGGGGITYAGSSEMAAVTADNAVDLALGAYNGGPTEAGGSSFMALSAGNDAEEPGGPFILPGIRSVVEGIDGSSIDWSTVTATGRSVQTATETIPGSCGGSQTMTIKADDSTGNFSGSLRYDDYCEGGLTTSGTTNISGNVNLSTFEVTRLNLSFDGLTLNSSGGSVTMRGTLGFTYAASSVDMTFDYLIRDNASGEVYRIDDYVITAYEGTNWVKTTYSSGRFYHPDYGYLEIAESTPFMQYTGDDGPYAGQLVLSGAQQAQMGLTALSPNAFEVTYDIDGDGFSDGSSGILKWSSENTAPVADAGPDQQVAVTDLVQLDGTGSMDADGDPLSYSWTIQSAPAASNAVLSDPQSPNPTFLADEGGTYVLTLVVNDATVDSAADHVTVNAQGAPGNPAPVANAGPDQLVLTSSTVQLDGTASSDIDGDPLSYRWEFQSRPVGSGAALSNTQAASPTFVADVNGSYVLSLIVNDGVSDSSADQVTVTAQEDISVLPYQVTDAEYSNQLDRVIMVSDSPGNSLHIHDPLTGEDSSVALPLPPTSVSVGPDGLHAAVGHDGWISYVDLATGTLVKTFAVTTDVLDIVLAGNGYVYAFPRQDQWESIRCLNIETEVETTSGGWSIYAGTVAKLHPSGTAIYGADNGLSPSDIEKYDISTGTATYLYDSPYHGDYGMCGDLWLSEDGMRIFTACGNVFRSSTQQSTDMLYNGSLSDSSTIEHLSHSSAANKVVAIPDASGWSATGLEDTQLHLYGYDYLTFEGTVPLPNFLINGQEYAAHGKFVFFSADGSRYFVIVQADGSAGMLYDFAIVAY